MYEIEFTADAVEDLHSFRRHEQNIIIDAIDVQLVYEPMTETNNR
jgi:mRNA-degrading endonuclease RelE of RelBE toxin-antitoxin system